MVLVGERPKRKVAVTLKTYSTQFRGLVVQAFVLGGFRFNGSLLQGLRFRDAVTIDRVRLWGESRHLLFCEGVVGALGFVGGVVGAWG